MLKLWKSGPWRPRAWTGVALVGVLLGLAAAATMFLPTQTPVAQAYSATSKDYIETVIANGMYYAYDQGSINPGIIPAGWSGWLTSTTQAARYNTTTPNEEGPCFYKPAGQPCSFDNYTIYLNQGHRWESIEAYGRYWYFDMDNGYARIAGSGGTLSSVPAYNSYYTTSFFTGPGPCYGTTGANCKIDSRGVYWSNNRQYEALTASVTYLGQTDDYYYVWDITNISATTLVNAGRLKAATRFAATGGPCAPARVGTGRCTFDTRDYYYDPTTHHLIESIVAQGQFWNYDTQVQYNYGTGMDFAPLGGNGGWMSDVPRYNLAGRPCYNKPQTACVIKARLFQYNLGADMLWELEGYGQNTTGGLGGRVVRVTSNLDNDVGYPVIAGTLRWALEKAAGAANVDDPLIITFNLAADKRTIALNAPICVASNKTLDGRGSEGVTITGNGLHITKHPNPQVKSNVIINNVTFAGTTNEETGCPGELLAGGGAARGDESVRLTGATNVWLHHLTLRNSTDGLIDIVSDPANVTNRGVTISWSKFENHDRVLLIGDSAGASSDTNAEVTLHHNFFNATRQRHPRLRYGKVDAYNNYLFHWVNTAMQSTCSGQLLSEGNIYERGPGSNSVAMLYQDAEDTAAGCSDGFGRETNNWLRNGGHGVPTITSRLPGNVFTRSYTAYSLQSQVVNNDALRLSLVNLTGQR